MYWIIAAAVLLVAPLAGLIIFAFFRTYHRGKEIPLESLNLSETHYAPYADRLLATLKEIKSIPYEPVRIKSYDGLTLGARYYDFGNEKTVIALHGYRATPFNNVHAAFKVFRNLGYNVLLVSQRAHFDSGGRIISFGTREKNDLLSWLDWLRARTGGKEVALFGVSMGAATICLAADRLAEYPEVKFMALECGYRTGCDTIKNGMHKIGAFGRLLAEVSRFSGILFGGFDIGKEQINEKLAKCTVPALFIHGGADVVVPVAASEEHLKALASEKKDLVVVDGAGHAEAFIADPEKVESAIRKILGNEDL
jgi:alpha-beta hydrolase superfamily lysophospholipase